MPQFDPARLVFLDETWATTAMARTHGFAPKGARRIAAVRLTGMVAPMVADGALTGDLFVAYLLKRLLRTAAERTADGLWACLGRLADAFRPNECRNDFRHCGDTSTPPCSPL